MFKKILIANRGEIACRVAATARRLGVQTVAVYSDADAQAKHVAACDEALHIGGSAPKESYLQWQRIIEAAQATGAQAIHPGYGFLSENEEFAQACADAGLVFIGPPASAIAAMGLKAESKRLMDQAGVPLVPGYHGANQDAALLQAEADRIGYPVLIKASAGGGGKGMRAVEQSTDFAEALASCKREATNSFGDDAVLIEKYVQRPRHIEIQVFADSHGRCVYLHERDCSVQRRHQKVLEEAPAPGMSEHLRKRMGEAAVAAAQAVGYVGAGTVEFIVEQTAYDQPESMRFYFMEMNTRLQVEHPVTEAITGLDLVEWQLRVAAGERLPRLQEALTVSGHAIEVRVYAENPDRGFLPSTGKLVHLRTPAAVEFAVGTDAHGQAAAVRIDSGIGQGDAITPHYDPMIAKLIVWGEDRAQAIRRMQIALADFEAVGPSTNVDFLARLMRCRAFVEADLDTALIEREAAALAPSSAPAPIEVLAAAAAAVLTAEAVASDAADPWSITDGFRVHARQPRILSLNDRGQSVAVGIDTSPGGFTVHAGGESTCLSSLQRDGDRITGLLGTGRLDVTAVLARETLHLFMAQSRWQLGYAPQLSHAGDAGAPEGQLSAPMPGKVIALLVEAGTKVRKGQPMLVMEAMKMEHTIAAPADGTVQRLPFAIGDQVAEGALLVEFVA
jgi:3-methylcrotonyl-CoA carboxylase alpha subunit